MSRNQSPVESNSLGGLSIVYINQEGAELPIKNMKDFKEAITFAKCNRQSHLNLIFYDQNLKPNEAAALNSGICAIAGKFSSSQNMMHSKSKISSDFSKAENCEDSLPEWFKQYMDKFKGEILQDLRSSVAQMVHEEFDKKKQLARKKIIKSIPDKNKSSLPIEPQKRKKNTYKNNLEELEKRHIKLLKKIENLRAYKLQTPFIESALSKLENKARTLREEKKKLLDRESQQKAGNANRTPDWEGNRDAEESEKKNMKNEKSGIFLQKVVLFTVQPGAEFSVKVGVINNGECPLVSPRMQCLNKPEIYLKEHVINLSRLEPGELAIATIKGKVGQRPGNYYFLYQLFDGSEEFIGSVFTCYAIVADPKQEAFKNYYGQPKQEAFNNYYGQPDPDIMPFIYKYDVDSLYIDVNKDVIEDSQKKIKENIMEIEKMLKDIDLFCHCTRGDKTREAKLINNAKQFKSMGCDLLQGKEKNCWKKRLQEAVTGVDLLQQNDGTEKSRQMDGMVKSGNSQTKKIENEVDSDSELSVIFMSEEEENFFFFPPLSENSNSEAVNNTTNLSKVDFSGEPPGVIFNESLKENVLGDVSSQQFKEKCFAPLNATFNTLSNDCPVGSSLTGEISSLRNETGDEMYYDECALNYFSHIFNETTSLQDIKTNLPERKNYWFNPVPTSDCFGNPIYAVRNDGCCLEVKDLIQNEEKALNIKVVDIKEKAQNKVKEETNINCKGNAAEGSTVTTVPNVSMNSASSLESAALNAANSTVDYFQSALKPEVEIKPNDVNKPERPVELPNNSLGRLHSTVIDRQYVEGLENQKLQKYMDAKLALHEMGFVNDRLNFHLLKKHDSEVIAVVNEILDMPPAEPPQDVEYFF